MNLNFQKKFKKECINEIQNNEINVKFFNNFNNKDIIKYEDEIKIIEENIKKDIGEEDK